MAIALSMVSVGNNRMGEPCVRPPSNGIARLPNICKDQTTALVSHSVSLSSGNDLLTLPNTCYDRPLRKRLHIHAAIIAAFPDDGGLRCRFCTSSCWVISN
jgi:hypothetical protein